VPAILAAEDSRVRARLSFSGFRFKDGSSGELAETPYMLFRSTSHRSTLWGRGLRNEKGACPLDLHEFWVQTGAM
jgi:hypothetical protein